jgi:predicted nucleic acid-binding protein
LTETVLIDTDVLIDFLRGRNEARAFIETQGTSPYISAVSVAEIFAGVRDGEREDLEAFLAALRIVPITEEIARDGGLHRRNFGPSHGTGLVDGIIAATSIQVDSQLVTLNRRHYPMIEGIVVPY